MAGLLVFIAALGACDIFTKKPRAVAHIEVLIADLYNLTGWCWSFALIGLFLRHMQHQNRVLRHVSESA